MMTSEEILRRLTIGDLVFSRAVLAADPEGGDRVLDAHSRALLQLGALIAAGSAGPLWDRCVDEALLAGLSFDKVVGALLVLAPTIGIERMVAIAPLLARALEYDVDAALERLGDVNGPAARDVSHRSVRAAGV
jgi:alkylhydroperoxidase/carboxymuconolactone decarboxylase family protein YurZ